MRGGSPSCNQGRPEAECSLPPPSPGKPPGLRSGASPDARWLTPGQRGRRPAGAPLHPTLCSGTWARFGPGRDLVPAEGPVGRRQTSRWSRGVHPKAAVPLGPF